MIRAALPFRASAVPGAFFTYPPVVPVPFPQDGPESALAFRRTASLFTPVVTGAMDDRGQRTGQRMQTQCRSIIFVRRAAYREGGLSVRCSQSNC